MRPRLFAAAIALGALAICVVVATGASAQSASGTVTGRVLWGACIRAIPLPMSPDAQGQVQGQPDVTPPGPASRPVQQGLPAGAVLVAVQNTSLSARTDETGRFTLNGVPAGQYLTVAAGPVGDSMAAIAERPNVFVNGGQSMDIGTLSLGGTPTFGGIACRVLGVPGIGTAEPQTAPGDQPNPAPPTSP